MTQPLQPFLFNVFWDGTAVQIESDQPYTGEHPAEPELTDESVQTILWGLREQYPTGTVYGAFYRSYSSGPYGAAPTHCAGWATLCSDATFGDLPWRRTNNPNWEDIRPGDLIRYDNSYGGHVAVVLDKTDEYITVTESGTNNKARWGGQYFRWWLEEQPGYALFTRYPEYILKSGWAALPQTRRAVQLVLPVSAHVRQFVPTLRTGWYPYTPSQ